jgi:large subunit ribosomal protein L3
MSRFILGKKLGMTTLYGVNKEAQNVTLIECGARVAMVRNCERDGYVAVQFEIDKTKKKKTRRECKVENSEFKKGDIVGVEIFQIGDIVQVSGIAKAKGFQGVVKRHGFKGSPKTHGHKHDLRAPGAIGAGFPEHVVKGKRMAGRMGGTRSTSKNLKIVHIDREKNILGVKGSVPGVVGRIVEIHNK